LQTSVLNRRDIFFDFTSVPNYVGVERIELVMFNCPEKGTSVQNIAILTAASLLETPSQLATFNVPMTSCDSLVRACSPQVITESVIYLRFNPLPAPLFARAYLAEVEFIHADTPTLPTATTPDATTPPPLDTSLSPIRPTPSPSSTNIVVAVVSTSCVVLLIVCLLAAVLILWRCYYVKHHKHNTSQHTAEGEGHTHSHTQPVTLCEETGQVYYSMYNRINHNSAARNPVTSGAEFGEYSTLFHENRQIQPGRNVEVEDDMGAQNDRKKAVHTPESDTPVDQLYAQVKDRDATRSHTPEGDTPVDQLYAQVDKKKKDRDATRSHTPEVATQVEQLYAQVDKKNNGNTMHNQTPKADKSVDQLYAQVYKNKIKGK
jgi:hypothetical protein